MVSDICNDTLWDGNIVTCPLCDKPGILIAVPDATDYKGEPCKAYQVGHTVGNGKHLYCIAEFDLDTDTGTRIVKKELES